MPSPIIGPDNTYEKQRKCRMQDAIDDYLNDEKVSSRQTYEEMLSCINDVIEYHEKAYCRARGLYDLMIGNREVDPFIDDPGSSRNFSIKYQSVTDYHE